MEIKEDRVPTGIAIRDVREQLFDAAERVLFRAGPSALTSRAVTTEAGVAKGVLHRHFADFDAFLADFVLDRYGRLAPRLAALRDAVGTRTVADNVADMLTDLFDSVAVAIIPLITFRDGLRARLRQTWPTGVPILTEAGRVLAAYLTAERERGRIAADTDIDALGLALIGGSHLLVADRVGASVDRATLHRTVGSVLAGVPR
jgi:AcrR family transcriptional regulator